MKRIILPLLLATVLPMTACGNTANTDTTTPKDTQKVVTQPQEKPKEYTANDVINKLKQSGLEIDKVDVLNESTDKNKLLGRPGQYIAKTNFSVKGLPDTDGDPKKIDVGEGGSVEVFAGETDAKNRFDFLNAISKSNSMFAEYEYLHGKLILRLSKEILPSKATEYQKVFESLN